MPEKNSTLINLHHLLDYDARRFTSAEIQLSRVLPDWISQAYNLKLKSILQRYFEMVNDHVKKLEEFIAAEEIYSLTLLNRVIQAFIEETNEKVAECADMEVRDAALLESIQAMNHFKIASYGTAAAFANELGKERAASIFHEIEVNEKQIDDRLSQLAEHEINPRAKVHIIME
jgi:ferritin-like metal-binding protein YciE